MTSVFAAFYLHNQAGAGVAGILPFCHDPRKSGGFGPLTWRVRWAA
jgi:hypothetical protein